MVIWRLSGERTSIWHVPYYFLAYFLFQGVGFGTRRKILRTLLQLIVFMMLILSNVYSGLLTSLLIQPPKLQLMKTFDEVLDSNLKIYSGEYFNHLMQDDLKYQAANDRGQIYLGGRADENLYDDVIVARCDNAMAIMSEDDNSKHYYIVNEKSFPYYVQLDARYVNPFIRQWQTLMDRCFEAGLTKVWKRQTKDFEKLASNGSHDYLVLSDIYIVLGLLFIGYGLGLFVLLLEIFYHDFIAPMLMRRKLLSAEESQNPVKIKNSWFKIKLKKRRVKHRVIMVKPFEIV